MLELKQVKWGREGVIYRPNIDIPASVLAMVLIGTKGYKLGYGQYCRTAGANSWPG